MWEGWPCAALAGLRMSFMLRHIRQTSAPHLVGVDAAVGAVGAPASLGRLLDADVLDVEVFDVERIDARVALGVLQKRKEHLGRLDWPAACARIMDKRAHHPTLDGRDMEMLSARAHPEWS